MPLKIEELAASIILKVSSFEEYELKKLSENKIKEIKIKKTKTEDKDATDEEQCSCLFLGHISSHYYPLVACCTTLLIPSVFIHCFIPTYSLLHVNTILLYTHTHIYVYVNMYVLN